MTKEEYYYGKLVFGGFDLKYAASGLTSDDIFWADMHSNHNYWVANMGSISFKEKQKEDDEKERAPVQLKMESTLVALDSGMSLAQIPVRDFQEITTYLNVHHGLDFVFRVEKGLYYTDCDGDTYEKLPDL